MVLKDQGTQNLHRVILAADGGYGKFPPLCILLAREIGSLSVMREHLLHCDLFVDRFFLQFGRFIRGKTRG